MTQDKNKGIGTGNIRYNFLNLPRSVRKSGADSLVYTYDATGRKLRQRLYGDTTKVTDYINEYVYEDNVLQFLNHAEGRVLMTGAPEYQYHLKDHLGNVRLTFTTTAEVDAATATLEAASLTAEQAKFLRIENARRIYSIHFDRTNGASAGYAQRLNGSTNEKFGMARSLSVMPGDTIRAEVYGKYVDTNTGNWTGAMTTLMGQIAAGAGGVVFEGGSYGSSTSSFSLGGLLNTTGSTGGPKAYLNWLIFDKNYNLVDGGYKRMSTAPKEYGQDVAHERLFLSKSGHEYIVVDQPGYVYVYLSNEEEAPVEVYFDDLKVEHAMGHVVQMDDYYPFGLSFKSYRRENSMQNLFQYNGKELQDEMKLGWLDYGARMYSPEIGRWSVIDPLADLSRRWSPYSYGYDNPFRFVDPDGMDEKDATKKEEEREEERRMEDEEFLATLANGDMQSAADMKRSGQAVRQAKRESRSKKDPGDKLNTALGRLKAGWKTYAWMWKNMFRRESNILILGTGSGWENYGTKELGLGETFVVDLSNPDNILSILGKMTANNLLDAGFGIIETVNNKGAVIYLNHLPKNGETVDGWTFTDCTYSAGQLGGQIHASPDSTQTGDIYTIHRGDNNDFYLIKAGQHD